MISYTRISAGGVYGQVYGTTNGSAATGAATTRTKVFTFETAQLSWVLPHDYKTNKVSVTLVDSNGRAIYAGVEATTDSEIKIYFTAPVAGTAIVTFIL
jgi:hypothetical protein